MSISNIDCGAISLPRETEGMSGAAATSAVNRDSAAAFRVLDRDAVSEMVGGNRTLVDFLPAPAIPEQLDEVVASATSALNRIDAKDVSTDLYSIMSLMLRVYQSQRTADREVRQAGYQIQAADQYAAADQVRAAADKRMWGSIISAGAQAIGGVVSIGGGVASGAMSVKGAGASWEAAGVLKDGNKADFKALESVASKWAGLAQSTNAVSGGTSSLTTSAGGLGNALQEKAATELDAKKMDLETTGRKQEQMTQEVNEQMQQLLDAIRDVLDKMRSLEQSRTEINRGIARL